MFPIGDTTVEWTAEDDSLSSASATQVVTVLGARAIQAGAKSTIEGLVGNDKNSQKELDKAIKHLEKSLHDDNWIDGDPTRLQEKKGKKVLDEDKNAVKSLLKIIEGKGKASDPAIAGDASDVIQRLVQSSRLLAEVALSDAREVLDGLESEDKRAKHVAREIAKAEKELAKVQQELDNGKTDKAIDKIKKTWEHSQHAIKAVNKKEGKSDKK